MAKFTRYLVIKVEVEVDMEQTDQDLSSHIDTIAEEVGNELDYSVSFAALVESGSDASDAIEVPTKITNTEVVGFVSEWEA